MLVTLRLLQRNTLIVFIICIFAQITYREKALKELLFHIHIQMMLMMTRITLLLILSLLYYGSTAQIIINGAEYYGDEWVDYSKDYSKIYVNQTGVLRLSYNDLTANGFSLNSVNGSQLQVFFRGEEIPIYTSTSGIFGTQDYIEFYAIANDGWLDQFMYQNPDMQLNPYYSMFSDESGYFLTVTDGPTQRYDAVDNDLSVNLPAVEPYYVHEELMVFSDFHANPPADALRLLQYSHLIAGEGYGSVENNTFEATIPASFKYTGADAPNPLLTVRQSFYHFNHVSEILVNDQLKKTVNHPTLSVDEYSVDLTINDIVGSTKVNINGVAPNNANDKSIKSYLKLVYPRKYNAQSQDNFSFTVEASAQERYYEIEDFNYSPNTVVLDITNGIKLIPEYDGLLKFKLPASSEEAQIVIYSSNTNSSKIKQVSFTDYTTVNPDYLIITTEKFNTGPGSGISDYVAYRESEVGGSHNVLVVNSEDLINQFAYGIDGHSLGISNFARRVYPQWTNLKYIYTIGKGLDYSNYRKNPEFHNPTWGYPGSDNLLLSEKGATYPPVSIGRLAVRSNESILQYLEKIKEYEAQQLYKQTEEEKAWTKKFIHLSGGTIIEQETIYDHLQEMEEIIENSKFGAEVHTYRKTSTDNTQTTLSQQIKDDINDGAFMITFFGHSSAGTFDFSIEEPSEYENKGKLPVIMSLGCHSGDVYTHAVGLSEKFVTEPEVGAIAFLASSGNAQLNAQSDLGKDYYQNLGNDMYGETQGKLFNATSQFISEYSPFDLNYVTLSEQFSLHGDPALDLFEHQSPDYLPTLDNVSVTPEEVSSNLDSITIDFEVINLGYWEDEVLNYMIIHDYEEDIDTFYGATLTPKFSKMVSRRIPIQGSKVLGKNVIDIIIDYEDEIAEIPGPEAELNNRLSVAHNVEGFVFFAFDGSAIPVYPTDFSIVVEDGITLKASTNNAFLEATDYTIQLDTTELFDSPMLRSETVTSTGGLIEWTPQINYESNTVYYWRVKNADQATATWGNASFIYYPEKSIGWNQSHYYQQLYDEYSRVLLTDDRKLDFIDLPKEHKVTNRTRRAGEHPTYYIDNSLAEINYDTEISSPDIVAGVYIVVIDPETSEPWVLEPGTFEYGAYSPANILGGRDRLAYPFWTGNPNQRRRVVELLEDIVPDGHYIMFFTIQSSAYEYEAAEWAGDEAINGRSIFSVLESQGATRVREMADEELPYIFAYQKGVGPLEEVVAPSIEDVITATIVVNGKADKGVVSSTKIGPASTWETLEWEVSEEGETDEYGLSIIGYDAAGQETILAEGLTDFTYNLGGIDAGDYPYLRLEYSVLDSISRSPAQLDYWRVYYKGIPELAINTNTDFEFNDEVLTRGDQLTLSYTVENISALPMDSIVVAYSLVDRTNTTRVWEQTYPPLAQGQTAKFDMAYDTDDLIGGLHELQVTVNPDYRQPEQFLFNNIGILGFDLRTDFLNPLLDVTFDGVRIQNGDIVSPQPAIQVCLTDDNIFSPLTDPELFTLALTYPNGDVEQVDVYGDNVEFMPAIGGETNKAVLIFTPSLEDGEYILEVQAKDNEGNLSGEHSYTVEFEVIDVTTISGYQNYPNPFSDRTNFVFTAKGSEIPTNFVMKIISTDGKVVRQFTQDDIGPLAIGVNRTYLTWDGTDGLGNRLPNGPYYYKLFFNKEDIGNNIQTKHDKGYGKLILMR